eukprot:4611006-Amphidinium_carterae.2
MQASLLCVETLMNMTAIREVHALYGLPAEAACHDVLSHHGVTAERNHAKTCRSNECVIAKPWC